MAKALRHARFIWFILHVTCIILKVAQTELSEAEYGLLVTYAEKHGMSLKEALRQAARLLVFSDKVDPNDPIFHMKISPGTGRKERTSIEHDRILYGDESRSS